MPFTLAAQDSIQVLRLGFLSNTVDMISSSAVLYAVSSCERFKRMQYSKLSLLRVSYAKSKSTDQGVNSAR